MVSSMTAQRSPVRSMGLRRLSRVSWWYSWEPWEKLKRATHMPARSRRAHISTEREAGPRVQTILVLGRRRHISSGPAATHSTPAIAARRGRGEPSRVVGDRAGARGRSGQERRGEGRRSRGEADGSEGERIYEGWPGLRPVLVEGSLSCSSPRLQLTRGYMALIN